MLFVAPGRGVTFIEQDLETLAARFPVDLLLRCDHPTRRRLLPAALHRLRSRRCGLLWIWFADPYDTPWLLALARLFAVPSVVVVGGYETAALPELGYGSLSSGRRRRAMRMSLRLAGTVLPTSHFLAGEVRELGRERELRVIPPGIDTAFFRPQEDGAGREPLVVTVATLAEPTWRIKGLDLFAAASRRVPEARFVVLGPSPDAGVARRLAAAGGDNFEIVGRRLAPHELLAWYQRAAVYAQLSLRESFGVALAEAMATGCVPVATRRGALPEVVDGCGYLVEPGDAAAAAAAIRRALARSPSPEARASIEARFPIDRRRSEILALACGLAPSCLAG